MGTGPLLWIVFFGFFFSKEDTGRPIGTGKMLNSTSHQGMQKIKTVVSPHECQNVHHQRQGITNGRCGEKETPVNSGQDCTATIDNSMEDPQKNKKQNYHMVQQFHFWKYIQRKQNTNSKRYLHLYAHSSIIYIIAKTCK